MSFLSFFGNALLGLGPILAVAVLHVGRKSFLILVTLFSTVWYLLALLLVGALLRGGTPLPATPSAYAGSVVFAVVVQECFRCVHLHSRT